MCGCKVNPHRFCLPQHPRDRGHIARELGAGIGYGCIPMRIPGLKVSAAAPRTKRLPERCLLVAAKRSGFFVRRCAARCCPAFYLLCKSLKSRGSPHIRTLTPRRRNARFSHRRITGGGRELETGPGCCVPHKDSPGNRSWAIRAVNSPRVVWGSKISHLYCRI